MTRLLQYAAFFTGLAALAWVGSGYVGSNPLALIVTLLIGAFYLMGALELHRFGQATSTLAEAVARMAEPLPDLRAWLARVPSGLQNSVRRRIEGEHVGLPGPALTPYLAGLLVLLGMLGTFLGMVLTLRGTGLALDTATDLQSVRTSLVAPVKGLGLAFGTSVAGVATSAALGLLSALSRRERVVVGQALDARIATTLRVFSSAHQREETLKLLQRQADLMPAMVDSLRAMTEALARQASESNAHLLAGQEAFHGRAELAFTGLASSVGQSLKDSLAESARVAGATLRPVAEATMAGIARETSMLHASLADTAQQQLGQLTTALDRFAQTFEQRSTSLLGSVADAVTTQLDGVSTRLDGTARQVAETWRDALARNEGASERLSTRTGQALATAAAAFEQHSTSLLRSVEQAHARLQSDSASRDERRVAAFAQSIEAMAASLQREWQQAGAQALAQQERLCETMERSARDVAAQSEAHARSTVAEIARLLEAAAEAPRAAAEVIAELREKLSASMARDNSLLDERARILDTLGTLLDTVNQAATEQRGAIDALVGSSADLLNRVGARFDEQVDAQAGKLAEVAAQVTGSAVEVASLGEAFGFAVQLFSQSNDKLTAHLQRIDTALGKSMSRSDEQLAYYVAQAREVIDLSMLSQKQIIEDLQRLSIKATPAKATA